jgi:NAD-dependent deacetylase
MEIENGAKWLAEQIKEGEVVIFTGAGMSTESGLQDFRSKGGLWDQYDPAQLASVGALERNYDLFIRFYKDRLYVPDSVKPNIGHELIAKWESEGYIKGVITQNVDRLHQKAGSKNVAELHGSLEPVRCHSCGKRGTVEDFIGAKRCSCGGKLRPGVVLFGEMLPADQLNLADTWSSACKTFIVLGSSLVVSPANYFPRQAKGSGAKLAIINRDPTPLDYLADLAEHQEIGAFLSRVDVHMK